MATSAKMKVSATIFFFAVASTQAAHSRCDLANYVFQDQDGNEAIVKDIRECFGWFNRDRESLSSSSGKRTCYTENEVEKVISQQRRLYDVRMVGDRIYTILYQRKFLYVAENAIVGVPWLSDEVDPDLRRSDYPAFKKSGKIFEMLGGDVKFDFTKDAPEGFDTAEKLYKGLLGKQFIFKRCQVA